MQPGADRSNRRLSISLVLACIVFLACTSACQDGDRKFDEKLKQCVELGWKEMPKGTACLEDLLKANPNRIVIHSFLANNYLELHQPEKAENSAKIFLDAFPSDALGHESYCRILAEKGKLARAREECARAVQIAPDDVKIWLTTASVQEKAGQTGDAELSYKRALKLNPNDQGALLSLASFYERQGRLDEAIDQIEALLRLSPDNAEKLREGLKKLKDKRDRQRTPAKQPNTE